MSASGPLSYATAAGSSGLTPALPRDSSTSTSSSASPVNASPVVSKSSLAKSDKSDGSADKSADADAASIASPSTSASPSSASPSLASLSLASPSQAPATVANGAAAKKVALMPAPAPSVNAWSVRPTAPVDDSASAPAPAASSPYASGSSSANNSSTNFSAPAPATKSLDPMSWPKPDESSSLDKKDGAAAVPKPRPGKEKWVPYTPVVTPAPPASAKPKAKARGKHAESNGDAATSRTSPASGKKPASAPKKEGTSPGAKKDAPKSADANSHGNSQTASTSTSPAGNAAPKDKLRRDDANGQTFANPQHPQHPHPNGNGRGPNGFVPPFFGNARRPSHMNSKNFPLAEPYNTQQMLFPHFTASQFEMSLNLVIAQIEYYMSTENMVKDIFLRRHMNSQGFFPLTLLASFNRIKSLTNGDFNFLVEACRWAPSAEILGDRVRPRFGWEVWVLKPEERVPAGREEMVLPMPTDNMAPVPAFVPATPIAPIEDDNSAPKFNAAAAVPFVPKQKASASANAS